MCVWLSPATKTAIFFTLSRLQSVRSQREWKLILTQGIREDEKKLRCVEIMRSLDVSWEDMGWCRQMHNSHLHPRTHTHRGTFNHKKKSYKKNNNTHILRLLCIHTLEKHTEHTLSHYSSARNTDAHVYTSSLISMHTQTDKLSTDEDLDDANTAWPRWSKVKNSDSNSVQNDRRFYYFH